MEIFESYVKKEAVNYSLLSSLEKHPLEAKNYLDGVKQDFSKGRKEGDILDLKIFSPDEFNKQYVVTDIKTPENKLLLIVNDLLETQDVEEFSEITEKDLINTAAVYNYNSKWLEETMVKNLTRDLKDYFDFKKQYIDKKIITTEEHLFYSNAVDVLKTHPFTSKYFEEGQHDGYEVQFQSPIYWTEELPFEGKNIPVKFKGLRDIVFIDHVNKTIRPLDLKKDSMGKSAKYTFSVWNYLLQAAMYYVGTRQEVRTFSDYAGYTVLRPIYIFFHTNRSSRPSLLEVSEESLTAKIFGGFYKNNPDARVKGYRELATELLWHIKHQKWDYPKEIYENDGVELYNNVTHDIRI